MVRSKFLSLRCNIISTYYSYLAWAGFWEPFEICSSSTEYHQLKLSKVVSEELNIQTVLVALLVQHKWCWKDMSDC